MWIYIVVIVLYAREMAHCRFLSTALRCSAVPRRWIDSRHVVIFHYCRYSQRRKSKSINTAKNSKLILPPASPRALQAKSSLILNPLILKNMKLRTRGRASGGYCELSSDSEEEGNTVEEYSPDEAGPSSAKPKKVKTRPSKRKAPKLLPPNALSCCL